MNEIEKLYENAGVEQNEDSGWICKNPDHCTYQSLSIVPENCSGCEYFERERVYPLFTAEKQLELVKFLLNKSVYYDADGDISDEIKNSKYREFDKAIAECINKRWEDLREDEKQQIKEILE